MEGDSVTWTVMLGEGRGFVGKVFTDTIEDTLVGHHHLCTRHDVEAAGGQCEVYHHLPRPGLCPLSMPVRHR